MRGWTAIHDPERGLAGEPESLRRLARAARARLFALVCDGTSGSYGFVSVRGAATRALLASGHAVVQDVGPVLEEEAGIHRDPPGEDDVKQVLERVAFPFAAIEEPGPWQVLTLEQHHDEAVSAATGRPWWRFW